MWYPTASSVDGGGAANEKGAPLPCVTCSRTSKCPPCCDFTCILGLPSPSRNGPSGIPHGSWTEVAEQHIWSLSQVPSRKSSQRGKQSLLVCRRTAAWSTSSPQHGRPGPHRLSPASPAASRLPCAVGQPESNLCAPLGRQLQVPRTLPIVPSSCHRFSASPGPVRGLQPHPCKQSFPDSPAKGLLTAPHGSVAPRGTPELSSPSETLCDLLTDRLTVCVPPGNGGCMRREMEAPPHSRLCPQRTWNSAPQVAAASYWLAPHVHEQEVVLASTNCCQFFEVFLKHQIVFGTLSQSRLVFPSWK